MTEVNDDDMTMNAADLFENIFEEIVTEAQAQEQRTVLEDTVTPKRLELVAAQKAKSLLKPVKQVKAGKAGWVPPN